MTPNPDFSHYLCTIPGFARRVDLRFRNVLARGVGRREQELGLFRCCGCSEQFDLSVGLGTIPRFLRLRRRVSLGRAARAGGCVETGGSAAPHSSHRTARGHGKFDAPDADTNTSANLEQLETDCAAAHVAKCRMMQPDPAHGAEQNVSERCQP